MASDSRPPIAPGIDLYEATWKRIRRAHRIMRWAFAVPILYTVAAVTLKMSLSFAGMEPEGAWRPLALLCLPVTLLAFLVPFVLATRVAWSLWAIKCPWLRPAIPWWLRRISGKANSGPVR